MNDKKLERFLWFFVFAFVLLLVIQIITIMNNSSENLDVRESPLIANKETMNIAGIVNSVRFDLPWGIAVWLDLNGDGHADVSVGIQENTHPDNALQRYTAGSRASFTNVALIPGQDNLYFLTSASQTSISEGPKGHEVMSVSLNTWDGIPVAIPLPD